MIKLRYRNTNTFFLHGNDANLLIDTDYAGTLSMKLYEHRGYKTVGHGIYELENGVKLVYEIMEKRLDSTRHEKNV